MTTERQLTQAVMEREQAEEALSHAYYLVTGRSPEWSNHFGCTEALEEIGDACSTLRQTIKQLRGVIAFAQNKAHILHYTKGGVSKQCKVDCEKLFVALTKALTEQPKS